jgi:dihydrodipicolinate synthase/N-acetylneuraminate lyase
MRSYIPYGVSPAVLLPFDNDLAIDEAAFRKHLRDVAATDGISAITINAHSTEVASCTFDEQRKVLDIARDEIGARLPLVNGIWADGSPEAARIARMATAGGASALLVFPPAPFTLGQSPQMALAHFSRIAEASDLSPLFASPKRFWHRISSSGHSRRRRRNPTIRRGGPSSGHTLQHAGAGRAAMIAAPSASRFHAMRSYRCSGLRDRGC